MGPEQEIGAIDFRDGKPFVRAWDEGDVPRNG